jgi:hypothetical protein
LPFGSTVIPARAFANGPGSLIEIELRQNVRDLPSHPGTSRRVDDGVPVIGQRGDKDIVVVRQHRDLVLRRRRIALEHEILQRALQAGHLLRQPFAAVFLRRAFGLGT